MMTRRSTRARAYAPDPAAQPGRPCDSPGCAAEGAYRAPKSRTAINDYHWFCLEHVRAYNASWDYYRGMTPGQIEAETRHDTSWQRPTWPLGTIGRQPFDETMLKDPLQLLRDGKIKRTPPGHPAKATIPAQLKEPMDALGLEWPVSMDVLKTRYKELAKRHHPDANGGDRGAEERLKTINIAYAAVRHYLAGTAALAPAQ